MQNKLYGITHDVATGEPVIKVPRTCKVSIGTPKGKDIHAEFQAGHEKPWVLTVGKYDGGKRTGETASRYVNQAEAKKGYRELVKTAPERQYPGKLDHFTFRRIGPDGLLEPDWPAIEAHGLRPRILDIIFTDDSPMDALYEMWGAGTLKCKGDGINAERVLEMAATPEEKKLAEQSKAAGLRRFPIVNGCKCRGCLYAIEKEGTRGRIEPPECKPHARLAFQLIHSINLGGKAEFDTTSYRSISQLFSSMSELLRVTAGGRGPGFLAGIPLQLVLRPYSGKHNGQPYKAYGVHLEFRAESFVGLRQKLLSYGSEFRAGLEAPQKAIEAADDTLTPGEIEIDAEEAAALEAEFYTDGEGFTDDQKPTETQQAETSTAKATSELKEKLARKKKAAPAAPAASPDPLADAIVASIPEKKQTEPVVVAEQQPKEFF